MKSIGSGLGVVGLLVAGSFWLAACAAQRSSETAAPPAPAASQPGMPSSTDGSGTLDRAEPATLAEAEALLDKARADFDLLALNTAPPVAAGAAAPAEAAPAPAPPATRAEKKTADKAAEAPAAAPQSESEAPSTCERACKAFSSLSRASDAVCRLDAEGGQRCQRARQIQDDASRRVASCGCAK